MKDKPADPLRMGAVSFLNARPLVHYLDPEEPPPFELCLQIPSRLTEMMKQGLLDVALLPSIEYFRADDYRIIPGISISSNGIVESVRIFSKIPIEDIRSLALDVSSRTSVALARILFKRRFNATIEFTDCSPDTTLDGLDADAMLLIGDAAMKFTSTDPFHSLDLGEEWTKLTGLPFVYAMWVAKSGIRTDGLQEKLLKARDEGLANLDEMAKAAGGKLGLSEEICFNYLKNVIHYELGDREMEALKLFRDFAAEDDLCKGDIEIAFVHE